MTTRHSARFYRLIGKIGTSRLVSRIHPPVYRLTGGRWLVGRNLGVLNVIGVTTGRKTGKRREIPLVRLRGRRGARPPVVTGRGWPSGARAVRHLDPSPDPRDRP
jgi:hypothetical protein